MPIVVLLIFYPVHIANFRKAGVKREFAEGLDLKDPKGKNFQAQEALLSSEITGQRKHIEDEPREF